MLEANTQAAAGQTDQTGQTPESIHEMHFSIAEFGKVQALKNKHDEALKHYREAIRLAVSSKAPEIFFRHYTQCVLESLEYTGSFSEVIEFCTNADQHYQSIEVKIPLHLKDHGSVLERLAINQLKAGAVEDAKLSLAKAIDTAGSGRLPLTEELSTWLKRGLTVEAGRLLSLQKKHKYFVVRKGQVDAKKARPMPTKVARMDSV